MTKRIESLLATKGHAFERQPFCPMTNTLQRPDADTRTYWTHVEHPAAGAVHTPDNAARYDVIVLYDKPGVKFTQGSVPLKG